MSFLEANDFPSLCRDGSFYSWIVWDHGMMRGRQTNSILVVFVYLMMNHPEVQQRAQSEIDRVVGQKRLPDFEDRASLPYVDAILRETMRWHPVVPSSFCLDAWFLDPLTCSSRSSCHHRRRCLSRVSHSARWEVLALALILVDRFVQVQQSWLICGKEHHLASVCVR